MPLYEYQCSKCENRFEELIMRPEDEADLACPKCQSTQIFPVLTSFAVGHSAKGQPVSSCSTKPGCGSGGFT